MADLSLTKIKHSGFSNFSGSFSNLTIESQPFAGGGFGDLYKCQKFNGKAGAEIIIKLLKDIQGTGKKCMRTVEEIQNIIGTYSPHPDQLLTDYPGLASLPLFSFEGKHLGKSVIGYSQFYLKDYSDFEEIIDSKYMDYQAQKVVRKLNYALRLVKAMDYLQKNKIIHSDINCSNLFVNITSDELVLLDLDSGSVSGLTEATTFGKFGDFLAPEINNQILQAQKLNQVPNPKVTFESDRWAIGVAVSYLIFLRHPLFFFQALTTDTYTQYKAKYNWPDLDPAESYINTKALPYYEKVFIKTMSHPSFSAIRQCFCRLINEGFQNPDKRPTYKEWINAITVTLDSLVIDLPKLIVIITDQINLFTSLCTELKGFHVYLQTLNLSQQEFDSINDILIRLADEAENQKNFLISLSTTAKSNIIKELDKVNQRSDQMAPLKDRILQLQNELAKIKSAIQNLGNLLDGQISCLKMLEQKLSSVKQYVNIPGLLSSQQFDQFILTVSDIITDVCSQKTAFLNAKINNLTINVAGELAKSNIRDAKIQIVTQEINTVTQQINTFFANLKTTLIGDINHLLNGLKLLQPVAINNLITSIETLISDEKIKNINTFKDLTEKSKQVSFPPFFKKIAVLNGEVQQNLTALDQLSGDLEQCKKSIQNVNYLPIEKDLNELMHRIQTPQSNFALIQHQQELVQIKAQVQQLPNVPILTIQQNAEILRQSLMNILNTIPKNLNMKVKIFYWADFLNPLMLIYKIRHYRYFKSFNKDGDPDGLHNYAQANYAKNLHFITKKNLRLNQKQQRIRNRISNLNKEMNRMIAIVGGLTNLLTEHELENAKKKRKWNRIWIILLLLAETLLAYVSLEAVFPPSNPHYRGIMFALVRFALSFVSTYGLMLFIDQLFLTIWPPKASPWKGRLPVAIVLGFFSMFILFFIVGLAYMRSFNYEKNLPVAVGIGFILLSIALPILAGYLKFGIDSMKNYLETVKYRKLEVQKQNSETELAVTQEKEEAIFSKAVTRTWKQIINLKTIKVDGDSSLDNTFFDTYEKLHQYFTDKYGKLSNP